MVYQIKYFEVSRQIDFYLKQKHDEQEKLLIISDQGLACARRSFTWKQLHDVSYKPFSSGEGLLYLHTYQGMFSYRIKDNPFEFLDYVRDCIGDHK